MPFGGRDRLAEWQYRPEEKEKDKGDEGAV